MSEYPFFSVEVLRERFIGGLDNLLGSKDAPPKLGHFILVAANALFDAEVYEQTAGKLELSFAGLRNKLHDQISNGRLLSDADDDQLVFLKLALIGWRELGLTEQKTVGPWRVQFNHFRSFRPRRQAVEKITTLRREFDRNAFHYNKPYLKPEIYWQGTLAAEKTIVFYNKFPFVHTHLNIVPICGWEMPQFLSSEAHQYAWTVVQELSGLTGFGMGYNSLGAFASVNHLHFQMFLESDSLPVMQANWRHNGGSEDYPTTCFVFTSRDESWKWLSDVHERSIAYNLLYTPSKVYCFPRKFQGTYQQVPWTSGFAWYELSGGFITFCREDYDAFSADTVPQSFHDLAIPAG